MTISHSELISVLHAEKPAPDRAEKLQLYGRFIGDWDAKIITHAPDGAAHERSGEIHFGWILEGRAIQDVWMTPRLAERPKAPPLPVAGNWFGTTIRVYDSMIDAWHIYWIDPATNSYRQQIGRPRGHDIVQEGKTDSGALSRWSFTRITATSFHWLGESSPASDGPWQLLVEVLAQRKSA
ncbi:MAG TPA: hypothetical protein VG274_05090 [Rhizomicrobium sp.]|jgi:hypothetical protein|nr:hypothetical protein [Rhizomicrobium sp.]